MTVAEAKREAIETGWVVSPVLVELRQQANYWKAQHGRAVGREGAWKGKSSELVKVIRELKAENAQLNEELTKERAKNSWLQQQLFGRSSERKRSVPGVGQDDSPKRRKRGKKRGGKGHGRKLHSDLPTEEILHDLAEGRPCCSQCGKLYGDFPKTEDCEEIEWAVRVVRRVHKRVMYRKACNCAKGPGIVTAPVPPKLIPKGKFSIGFWVQLIQHKFLFQIPLHRIRGMLERQGLFVSQGTLTGGLKRIGELVAPLYGRILERVRSAERWHMDETRWLVFSAAQGKRGHRWWLWIAVTHDVCAYVLDPRRSSQVPKNLLGEDAEGILSVDRYSAYKALGEKIQLAFCWAHVRRDFVRVRDGYERYRTWAEGWVARIAALYVLNDRRLEVSSNARKFAARDRALRRALRAMKEMQERELVDENLPKVQRQPLASLGNHWDGLTLFAAHPEVPMDNNHAERCLRNPVVGRKNYYGSGTHWSGQLAASLFTIFQTLLLNDIDPQKYLSAYFQACAENGGRPPDSVDQFLPWNLSQDRKDAWRAAERPL